MKRFAVLIGSPSELNKGNYLPGVKTDIENIYGYLKSSIGGSWSDEEIISFFPNPKFSEVEPFLKYCEKVDFSFVYFSGHGFTDANHDGKAMFNQNEYISVLKSLENRSKKQLTIIDACRNYQGVTGLSDKALLEGISFPNINLQEARSMYEKHITKLPYARALLYASSLGFSAYETQGNESGLFSTSLLDVIQNKANSGHKGIYNINDIFPIAKKNTNNQNTKQLPQIYTLNDFSYNLPLGVNPSIKITPMNNFKDFINESKVEDFAKGVIIGTSIVFAGYLINSIFSNDEK